MPSLATPCSDGWPPAVADSPLSRPGRSLLSNSLEDDFGNHDFSAALSEWASNEDYFKPHESENDGILREHSWLRDLKEHHEVVGEIPSDMILNIPSEEFFAQCQSGLPSSLSHPFESDLLPKSKRHCLESRRQVVDSPGNRFQSCIKYEQQANPFQQETARYVAENFLRPFLRFPSEVENINHYPLIDCSIASANGESPCRLNEQLSFGNDDCCCAHSTEARHIGCANTVALQESQDKRHNSFILLQSGGSLTQQIQALNEPSQFSECCTSTSVHSANRFAEEHLKKAIINENQPVTEVKIENFNSLEFQSGSATNIPPNLFLDSTSLDCFNSSRYSSHDIQASLCCFDQQESQHYGCLNSTQKGFTADGSSLASIRREPISRHRLKNLKPSRKSNNKVRRRYKTKLLPPCQSEGPFDYNYDSKKYFLYENPYLLTNYSLESTNPASTILAIPCNHLNPPCSTCIVQSHLNQEQQQAFNSSQHYWLPMSHTVKGMMPPSLPFHPVSHIVKRSPTARAAINDYPYPPLPLDSLPRLRNSNQQSLFNEFLKSESHPLRIQLAHFILEHCIRTIPDQYLRQRNAAPDARIITDIIEQIFTAVKIFG